MNNNYTNISGYMNSQNLFSQKETKELLAKLEKSSIPQSLRERAIDQINRVDLALRYGGNISQLEIATKYIEWIISLPWEKKTEDIHDLIKAKESMDRQHYGLDSVKNRILEYLSILKLQNRNGSEQLYHAPVLFLVGLAGTGKTTFAKAIADTLGRKFARIPFGGLSSALDLRGLSRVQSEAEPGLVIKALRRVQSKNPVILLDELDRVTAEARGAVMGVLLELLDPQQNLNFTDHYIDYPFDLSQVLFIATANNTNNISTAVLDRMELIQMPTYKDEEKVYIASKFVLPKTIKDSGLPEGIIRVDDVVWKALARLSGYDPGIRSVERYVESIVRKIAYEFVMGKGTSFHITEENYKEYIE